jgi:hypothetical protein
MPRMRDTGTWDRAIAVAMALVVVGSAGAAEQQDHRIAEVVAARVELQRALGEWLAGSLAKPAQPFRVDPVVQLVVRGEVRELQHQEETIGGDVKFGGKTSVRLPGLGFADAGGNATPEVVMRTPGKRTLRTTRQLDVQVVRMVVRLYVDPAMPKDRRELIRALAADLAGIEPARGDELVLGDLPEIAAAATAPTPTAGPDAPRLAPAAAPLAPARRGLGLEHLAWSATALAAAAILAFGLSRRAAGAGPGRGEREEDEAEEGGVEIVDGRVIAPRAGPAGDGAVAERAAEGGLFPALAGITARELAEVLGEVEPAVAAAIIEKVGLGDDAARAFHVTVPMARQLDVGLLLGRPRVIARSELAQMETAAAAALARVRSRVTVGGASRLAAFLSGAPDEVRDRLLEDVAARDAAMADAARGAMVVFDDLDRLSPRSVRRVVTGIDPGVVALALARAPDGFRETVLAAISKRLRAIVEAEAEAARARPPADVAAARRVLERAMHQLNSRGELVPRASA